MKKLDLEDYHIEFTGLSQVFNWFSYYGEGDYSHGIDFTGEMGTAPAGNS